MPIEPRTIALRLLALSVLLTALLVALGGRPVAAQAERCPGNAREQQAPFSCSTSSVIDDITFTVAVSVDADGRAVVDVSMSAAQPAPVAVVVRSYTGISQAPMTAVDGSIPEGQTAVRLVVPQVNCGQLDVKAVHTAPGDRRGHLAGPRVTWGDSCAAALVPTTTAPAVTTTPITTPATIPASVAPAQVSGTLPPVIPVTGAGPVLLPWALGALGVSALLLVAVRRR